MPRDQHVRWDGLILHADDPWWNTHYPPNGWGCKCYVESLRPSDLRRASKTGKPDRAPPVRTRRWFDKRTGETHQVPEGIDPGWAYAPGQAIYNREALYLAELRHELADKASLRGLGVAAARQQAMQQYEALSAQVLALHRKNKVRERGLTALEKVAIYRYTQDASVNKGLWYKPWEDILDPTKQVREARHALDKHFGFVATLEAALGKLPGRPGLVRRGSGPLPKEVLDEFVPGAIVSPQAFWSATKNAKIPPEYKRDILLEIQAKQAKDISRMSSKPEHNEVLFSADAKFRVKERWPLEGEPRFIRLEEVGD